MRRVVCLAFVLGAFACICLSPLRGQTSYGSVNGSVTDPSGGSVASAKATLINVDTAVATVRETNASGNYVFRNVPPGNYTLSVTAKGFAKAEEPAFAVSVNDTQTHDFSLRVGDISQTVEVTAQAALLQQSSSELGTVIGQESVKDLPLNGRNFSQLLTLTPGATPVSTAQGTGGGTGFNAPVALPGSAFVLPSINGAWNRSNMYMLDGIINHWFFGASWAALPIVDAVQEFKVQSHNDKAEFGGVLGGVMNIVSKSGGNEFHGGAWEFLRNNAFDARDPFTDATASGPTPFRQNQFGATVGGPVILPKIYSGKNRTFFFFGYEGWRYRRSRQQTYWVPTDAELGGDFTNSRLAHLIYDPATTVKDPSAPQGFSRSLFTDNRVPSNRMDAVSVNYMKAYLDRPNYSASSAFNVINGRSQSSNANTYTAKVDQRFSDRDNVFFRLLTVANPQVIPNTLKNGQTFNNDPRNIGGGWIHLLGNSVVFDTKFGYVREALMQDLSSSVGLDPLAKDGWAGLNSFGAPNYGFSSPYSGAGMYWPRPETDWQWMGSEGVSWIKGNHSIKFGGMYVWQKRDARTTQHDVAFNDRQTANPNDPGNTGNSVASALLGLPAQYTIRNQQYIARWASWGIYGQDEWKVSSRVTLNFGLRYDTFNIAKLNPGQNNGFDWQSGNWVIGGGKMPASCATAGRAPCIPGKGDLSDIAGGNHIKVGQYPYLYRAPRDGFQPRLGVAWRLAPGTVLRAGYGVTFDTFTGVMQTFQQSIGTWPDSQFAQPAYNAVGDTAVSVLQANKIGGSPLPSASPFGSAGWYANPQLDNAYSHQFNVELQHQVTSDLAASIAYVGARTFRLDHNGAANTAKTPGAGTPEQVQARKPFPWQSTMFYSLYDGRSWYDSLQAKFVKRFSHGFQGLVSYTWSKSNDYASGWYGSENGIGGSAAIQDFYHPEASKGPAGYNVPHFLSIAMVYEFPFGKGKHMLNSGVGATVLGGWQINTIAQFRSGQPINMVVNGDVANIGNDVAWWSYARPNLVGDPHIDNPTEQRWFNTDAFAVPVLSYGNTGKNILNAPGVKNIDISLFKKFTIKERFTTEFRAESFNSFNIINLGAPNTTVGDSNFGRITSSGAPPRVLQFGLKLGF